MQPPWPQWWFQLVSESTGSYIIIETVLRTSKKQNSMAANAWFIERPSISWIKNSIKQNRVKHILRHIYYAASMQKLCKFEALYKPEIQYKSHKGNP